QQARGVSYSESGNIPDADPLFADAAAGDFRPVAGSPAIDMGLDLSADGVSSDIDGVPRPQGAGFDIGAFEYCARGACTAPRGSGGNSGVGRSGSGIDAAAGSSTSGGKSSAGAGASASARGADVTEPGEEAGCGCRDVRGAKSTPASLLIGLFALCLL